VGIPSGSPSDTGGKHLWSLLVEAAQFEHMLSSDPRIAAGLTAVRSGALAAGCGGGGVGLLVALEARFGTGLVGGTHSGEPFELTACRLVFSDRPGCGIKWDERAVRRFRLAT
jgi:hypothetical protein